MTLAVITSIYRPNIRLLKKTFDSLVNQTFKNFTVYVCIDGKDDDVEKIVQEYATQLDIKTTINIQNIGLTKSLNKLIESSIEPYVARLDAEDYCHPKRFQLQLDQFLNSDDLALCGSNYISEYAGNSVQHQLPSGDHDIRNRIYVENVFCHSAVMFKRFSDLNYDSFFKYSQDYELWLRFMKVGRCFNIQEVLTVRSETPGISIRKRTVQHCFFVLAKLKHIKFMLGPSKLFHLMIDVIKIPFYLTMEIFLR
jgi:glycosyltransferase involved in cell wall biosynthesis